MCKAHLRSASSLPTSSTKLVPGAKKDGDHWARPFQAALGCASQNVEKSIYKQCPTLWLLNPLVRGAPQLLTLGLLFPDGSLPRGRSAPDHQQILGHEMRPGSCAGPSCTALPLQQCLKSENLWKRCQVFKIFLRSWGS